jgi:hypothetical protein
MTTLDRLGGIKIHFHVGVFNIVTKIVRDIRETRRSASHRTA